MDNPQSKLDALLHSRKFWAATVAALTTVALYVLGEISADQFALSLTWIAGIYIGSVAVEDGLSRIFTIWLDTQTRLSEMPLAGTGTDTLTGQALHRVPTSHERPD